MKVRICLQELLSNIESSYALTSSSTVELCLFSTLVVKPKRKYTQRKVNPVKAGIKLSTLQEEVLVGTLLGDASLERAKPTHNTRLRFDQTFPNHASYLMMLYGIYYNLISKGPLVLIRSPDKRTGNVYVSMAVKTMMLPCFNY
jgi:hypothetical protein